jgi:peptide/nickel transport system permease protein
MDIALFALKRFVSAVVVLFVVSVLTFLIFFAIPNGDPALRLAGRTATAQTIATVRHDYGFDRPLYVQYLRTMKQVFDGSIQSYTQHVTVFSQIKRGLPATLSLAIGAAVIWMIIGIVLGVIGALRAGKATDVGITTFSFIGISAPSFVLGSILLYALTYKAHIFPEGGGYTPLTSNPVAWFEHLILPWFTLAVLYIGIYAQVLRSSVLDAMNTDAVRTARAKGLSPRRVLIKHMLRMSLIPIASLWGLDFAAVLGGSTLVVEKVFNLNGVGQYAADSVGSLDVPPVLVIVLLGAAIVVLMNAVVDVFYAVLDPRIRTSTA